MTALPYLPFDPFAVPKLAWRGASWLFDKPSRFRLFSGALQGLGHCSRDHEGELLVRNLLNLLFQDGILFSGLLSFSPGLLGLELCSAVNAMSSLDSEVMGVFTLAWNSTCMSRESCRLDIVYDRTASIMVRASKGKDRKGLYLIKSCFVKAFPGLEHRSLE